VLKVHEVKVADLCGRGRRRLVLVAHHRDAAGTAHTYRSRGDDARRLGGARASGELLVQDATEPLRELLGKEGLHVKRAVLRKLQRDLYKFRGEFEGADHHHSNV